MKRFISTDKNRKYNKLIAWIFIALFVVLWEVLTNRLRVPSYILPSPTGIIGELIDSFPLLLMHAKATMLEVLIGYVISLGLGVLIAILMNKFQLIKAIFYPLMVISQTIPLVAIAPLLMIWFGFGITPKIIVVVLVCFFPIAINLTTGLESADEELIDLLRSMKASEFQIFFKCKLKSALPSFFSGMKLAATYSVMGAVISEWIGASEGLGIFMTRVMKTFQTEALFADMLFIIIITLLFVAVIDILSKICMPWTKER
jgi:ABC-type nitrate/sulfonate/bicarbonate transport system permease component